MKGDYILKLMSLLAVLTVILCVCSCQGAAADLRGTVYAMLEAAEDRCVGSVYTSDSSQGSPDYLSSELLGELLGDFDFAGVRGAVYLCKEIDLFEISVFDCPDSDTAEAVGGLCAFRFDRALKTAKKLGLADVDFSVKIYGNRVLCALCRGSERVIFAGLEKIKSENLLLKAKKG